MPPAHKADPIDLAVGARLRTFRQLAGLSQTALGERLGITFQQVQKYEKGWNRISASKMVAAAKACGVAPAELIEGLDADDAPRVAANDLAVLRGDPVLLRELAGLTDPQRGAVRTIVAVIAGAQA